MGASDALDALAELEIEQIDRAGLVGGIRFRPQAKTPRMRSSVLGGVSGISKNEPLSSLAKNTPATLRLRFARADDRIAQPALGVEALGLVEQKLLLDSEIGAAEPVAGCGEEGQALAGQHLPIGRA